MAGRGEDDWGRWCHKNMPHLYNEPALARHDFTIDISRDSPEQDLGFAVDPWKHAKGLRVIAVRQSPPTPIVDWNENCRMWFPRDQLRVGDVIRQVNEEKEDDGGGTQVGEGRIDARVTGGQLRSSSCCEAWMVIDWQFLSISSTKLPPMEPA